MAADGKVYRASTTAPVNIAVIKYWGKRDASLNLPTNSSLSVTLSQRTLRAHTTATCSSSYTSDSLTLNGSPSPLTTPRTQACLQALRQLRKSLEDADPSLPKLSSLHLKLVSANNFPTAAGLASSAAGFAALVRAIADLYELPQSPEELSLIARQGSGSACRSLLGGYVAWDSGSAADGSDSIARLVAPIASWPTMRALILVVSAEKKDVPSTTGMQASVATSELFPARASTIVPKRMKAMEEAIAAKDFDSFAELTMRDSNTFHACCADTWPPISYMNDVSRAAVRMCEAINAVGADAVATAVANVSTAEAAAAVEQAAKSGDGKTKAVSKYVCAYTFDAGPNCVVFYEEANKDFVEGAFRSVVGHVQGWEGALPSTAEASSSVTGKIAGIKIEDGAKEEPPMLKVEVSDKVRELLKDGVSRVILTEVGEGPISVQDHLV